MPPRWIAILSFLLVPSPAQALDQKPSVLPTGHVFYACDFERDDALRGWSGTVHTDAGFRGGRSLLIDQSAAESGKSANCRLSLPVESMRGYSVYCSARVRAENVSAKPQPWNGIKVMLVIETPNGTLWPQAELDTGSFDWHQAAFRTRIPREAVSVSLTLGLEAVRGKAWFDDVRISVHRPPAAPRPATTSAPSPPGHGLKRLRGAMVGPDIDEAGLRTFGREWNANLIRWQLVRHASAREAPSLADYDAWLEGELTRFDRALPLCERYGLRVALDLHSPPGGRGTSGGYAGSDAGLFTDRAAQEKFVEVWKRMAARYRGNSVIWAFDLANEPVESAADEGLDDWHALATRAGKAIRQIDPERILIVEPADWGNPAALREFEPIDLPNVVYSVHMYTPHAFTHQNLSRPGEEISYPGVIAGKSWDKTALEAELQPVVDFQRAYGVPIYIGEFSAIRWAPGDSACRYLQDLIDIFEQNGWDWSYHAFREWHGWSVEHGSDRNDTRLTSRPTDRQTLLRKWYRQNEKPNSGS